MTNTTPMDQTTKNQDLPDKLTCEQLWEMEQNGENPTLLDVRASEDWDNGHIDYATHLPIEKIEEEAEAVLPNKSDLIITCCTLGHVGEKAAQKLQSMGYTNVKNLSGGYSGYCSREDRPEIEEAIS